jgi:hypothetical protein
MSRLGGRRAACCARSLAGDGKRFLDRLGMTMIGALHEGAWGRSEAERENDRFGSLWLAG